MTNKINVEEVQIDGETYVRKSDIDKSMADNYVVVRTYSAGVHAGELVRRDGKEVELKNTRRLWYWDGACSLSQIAAEGVKNPDNCRFSMPIDSIILTEAIEILPCTKKAQENLKGVYVWKK